jgi:NitT/TauT family transport system permease protein
MYFGEADNCLPIFEGKKMNKHLKTMFKLRGETTARQNLIYGAAGVTLWLFIWWLSASMEWLPNKIAPGPFTVLRAIPELHFHHALVRNAGYTLGMNLIGTLVAILISLPLGLILGLVPLFRGMSTPFFVGLRFIPLPVITGLFMLLFGIGYLMKTSFLTFAIIVYLVPTVMQRVTEVRQVYIDTVTTLGATWWQTVRFVFIPDVFARAWDDIVILVGLSWTYISIVELVNLGDGGIGALIYTSQHQSHVDQYYALLLIIMLIAFIQTKVFVWIGNWIFPYKKLGA